MVSHGPQRGHAWQCGNAHAGCSALGDMAPSCVVSGRWLVLLAPKTAAHGSGGLWLALQPLPRYQRCAFVATKTRLSRDA